MSKDSKQTIEKGFESATDAGRDAFMGYVQATTEMSAAIDALTRQSLGRFAAASQDGAEFFNRAWGTALDANRTARQAGVAMLESLSVR